MKDDFQFGEWLVQPSVGRATKDGRTIYLRAKVMDLLVFLAHHPGEVVSKDALLDGVWGTDALSESALTRSITELRQALEDDAEHPTLIETIPKRGYRTIAPVRPVIAQTPPQEGDWASVRLRRRSLAWTAAVLAALIVALAVSGRSLATSDSPAGAPVVRFLISPPDGTTFAGVPTDPYPAVSPDGRHIATVARAPEATQQIWIHALDALAPRALAGTDGATFPFWSPDGRFVGFFAHGKLKKVPAAGGPVETLADAAFGHGAAWSPRGDVLFAPTLTGPLFSVPSSGGQAVPVTTLVASQEETSHRFPQFLADGRHYIYLARSRRRAREGIFIGALGSSERKRLIQTDANAAYAGPDRLLFVRDSVLMAQRFDPRTFELVGAPVPVADGLLPAPTLRFAPFSAAGDTLVFRAGGMHESRLAWIGRDGAPLGAVGPPARYFSPALAPDGSRLAVDLVDGQTQVIDTWIMDVPRGVSTRTTFASSVEGYPLWHPDGSRIVLAAERNDTWTLLEKSVSAGRPAGPEVERVLLRSPQHVYPQTWSKDSRTLVYVERNAATRHDLWQLPLAEGGKPVPLLQTPFNETQAQLSPDGRWLAYTSDESGRFEVYLRPFADSAGKWRISVAGGCQPRWRGDGKELYYLHGSRLFAVPFRTVLSSPQPGEAIPLFETRVGRNEPVGWDYAPSRDGQRFLIKEVVYEHGNSAIAVVLNWHEPVRRTSP